MFSAVYRGSMHLTKHIIRHNDIQLNRTSDLDHVQGTTLLIAACDKERARTLYAELAKGFLRWGQFPKPLASSFDPTIPQHHTNQMMYDALNQLTKNKWSDTALLNTNEISMIHDMANVVDTAITELPTLLLDLGVDVNGRDHRNRTALFEAVQSFSLPLVELLLQRGSHPNTTDNSGTTPFSLARSLGLQDIEQMLVKYGAIDNEDSKDSEDSEDSKDSEGSVFTTDRVPVLPLNIDDLLPLLGNTRCDIDRLVRPSWKVFQHKYVRDGARPALISRGFRYYKKKKKKKNNNKKNKKYTVPKRWKKASLMKSKLSREFVMVGELPYGEITAPDNYHEKIPLKRYLTKYLGSTSGSHQSVSDPSQLDGELDKIVIAVETQLQQQTGYKEEERDRTEGMATSIMFDPNVLKSSFGRLLLQPFAHVRDGYTGKRDPFFIDAVHTTQLVIGPQKSGAPVHFHEASFSTLVSGIKLWAIWLPGDAFYSNVPSRKWWRNLFNATYFASENGAGDAGGKRNRPMLCVQHPGETIFVPPSFSHFTVVLSEESYSFADSVNSGLVLPVVVPP